MDTTQHGYFGAQAAHGGKVHLFFTLNGQPVALCDCPNTNNGRAAASAKAGNRLGVSHVNCNSGRRIIQRLRDTGKLPQEV